MIALSNVGLSFGPRVLFAGATWHLRPGARYGLVGANGSGKSTLIRIMAGELAPTAGSVARPNAVRIGVLRQDQARYAPHTPLEIVLMGRPALWQALKEKEALLAAIEAGPGRGDASELQAHRLATLEVAIADAGGYTGEAEAATLLEGLGIPLERLRRPMGELSGGYRLRALLAQTLFEQPELLLLDEPTNHLDIVSIRWLEAHLRGYPGTMVLVSHDRHFLDTVCDHIVDVDYQELTVYPGNYEAFVAAKELAREQREAEIARLEKKTAEMQQFVDRFRAKATKARQAQSRAKQIERMEAPEIKRSSRRHPRFRFVSRRHSGREVLRVKGVGKAFQGRTVLDGVGFELLRGEKLAVVGPNGVGKSTLLRMIAGDLRPDQGALELGYEVHPGYFAQDHQTSLRGRSTLYDWLYAFAPGAEISAIRGLLGQVLFSGDDALKRVEALSGGEAARLQLAALMLTRPNLLILDEPTNHLDLEGREALQEGLRAYDGTLVFVSHDRHFVSKLADRVLALLPGRAEDFPGSYEDYLAREGTDFLTLSGAVMGRPPRAEPAPARGDNASAFETRKARKREQAKLKRRVEQLEREIAQLEGQVSGIAARFADPVYLQQTPHARIRQDDQERQAKQRTLEQALAAWELASAELESVGSA
ncbi:MAG: ABC-F family ATP-binding cassette domain-containing protein [Candidatus Lambdaproteobacteria bacterium]|nr:ABC-F family ATP-binding cassette domain-containing protein [Candidatus Lambdaproteobacteria bacterium]